MDYMGQKGGTKRMIYLKQLGLVLIVMFVFVGCSFINEDDEQKKENQLPKEYATEQGKYIMECIVNKDKEGLKSVFSKHIAETHDLDKEIDEFFEFIDGEIISYDEPEGYEGGYTMRDGGYTEKELYGEIDNIKTDKGKTYSIGYQSYSIYKSKESYVGVRIVNIRDEDTRIRFDTYADVEQYSIGDGE